jgi:hypothetical protein
VVFARSSLNNDIGYALTSDEVRPKNRRGRGRARPRHHGAVHGGMIAVVGPFA